MCYNVTMYIYVRICKIYAYANFTLYYVPCVSGWYELTNDTVNVNILCIL